MGLLIDAVETKLDGMLTDLTVLKRAVRNEGSSSEGRSSGSKVRVPEPTAFDGVRSAKEVKNFVWDMENYFEAAKVPDHEKVTITSMYLVGDAKLWWRARLSDDASANRVKIETWEVLKRELKEQFLPCNLGWIARESLRQLKHKGTVWEYVKDFSSLLLDIRDMSDKDKLFNFMAGLQPWAQTELRRQGVNELPSAISAADRLVDYKVMGADDSDKEGSKKDKSKEKKFGGKGGRNWKQKESGDGEGSPAHAKTGGQPVVNKQNRGCFLCDNNHRMRDCPKRSKLNALMRESDSEEDSDETRRANPIQLLSALVVDKAPNGTKGLMYATVLINGKEVKAMVDSGATHNFVAEREVKKLGLTL
ncbi:PREDICTED: uncharacterized protein LOC105959382 [Erythranthe guttata]|uniref:uncharacterized protein LOC105959382 n=1 Tax=Erythranthe guttata TaxID=4155 RepID=UPI00064DD08D|nr:PREDICTED: uncharacterized protein LOC105959382 [Erythranthe guttata]|eukprot:XP_012838926.1 PREDICTED: uncharacterized protein LOC105959382 [Erythranthe guttata]